MITPTRTPTTVERIKREKVNAEITICHLIQWARDKDLELTEYQALSYLNQGGHANEMWKCMMRAGEEYAKSTLPGGSRRPRRAWALAHRQFQQV